MGLLVVLWGLGSGGRGGARGDEIPGNFESAGVIVNADGLAEPNGRVERTMNANLGRLGLRSPRG